MEGDKAVDNSRHSWLEKDNFDVVVLGTGFVESVLAGALSRVGKAVLHLDKNTYYGTNCSSFSLNQLNDMLVKASNGEESIFTFAKVYQPPPPPAVPVEEEVPQVRPTTPVEPASSQTSPKEATPVPSTTSETTTETETVTVTTQEVTADATNQSNEEQTVPTPTPTPTPTPAAPKKKKVDTSLFGVGRQFIIDLLPSLLYSKGPLVQLLISSATSKYLDFKCLDQNYMYINNTLQPIPSTKGSIFKDSTFSLKDKRIIMKFIDAVKSLTEEGVDQAQRIEELSKQHGGSFLQFVKSFNMSAQVEAFILYGISLVHPPNMADVSLAEGIKSVLLYITSLLVYGQLPFLIPYYGYGDIPQAFCRLCAVFGGIYVLDRNVKQLNVDADNQYTGIVCSEDQPIKSTYFITSPKYLSSLMPTQSNDIKKEFETTSYSRCICITDKRIINSMDCSYITIPPNSIAGNKSTVNVYQMESLCTARGYVLIHFTTIQSGANAEEDLKAVVETFVQLSGGNSELPTIQWCAYFNLSLDHVTSSFGAYGQALPKNVMLTSDSPVSVSIDYDQQINEAKALFEKICPGQTFLERVPDSEDIVWNYDEQTTTTTSTTTTSSTETTVVDATTSTIETIVSDNDVGSSPSDTTTNTTIVANNNIDNSESTKTAEGSTTPTTPISNPKEDTNQ
ncbi:hypothetical protein SAMD00019534_041920 [Acytostelium subglobosum LB1]|uniref:hypothetical protein n=1 Tax=Acytostelium subglobosum LB1 TaxID=1410327 RepID=UPI000644AF37|nr:hypothetical protein SAMD00019534_041920 [Acytostelium subglobosum LB1]GAM21017.1 hypothetical protein SAMD00019534_041920 [Acytostelium subglobosum LB1]|eukprot:XP_012756151.1 hypothetical protein SAMD00019534_041920 [Acytostelium subglobosum LB1]